MIFCFSVLLVLNHVVANWDFYVTILSLLLYSIRATKWGRSNAKALEVVADAVETLNEGEIKSAVRESSRNLPTAVVRAISTAVAKVDPKKPNPSRTKVLTGEVKQALSDIVPKRKRK